jgi:hypothetical protein
MKSPLLSQIVYLTKCILLKPDDESKRPAAQFFSGRQGPGVLSGGMGLEWWYAEGAFRAIETVARLIIESEPEFKDCDVESTCGVVTDTLKEKCVDRSLFKVDELFFGQQRALYDRRAADVPLFASAIASAIAHNLRAAIGRTCTIYAVPRLQSLSFELEEEPIRLIAKDDDTAWDKLIAGGYVFDGWTPWRPMLDAARTRSSLFAPPPGFSCVLVAEQAGTESGTRVASLLNFRRLLAVMVAAASERLGRSYSKAAAKPFEFCIQFPHVSFPKGGCVRSECDSLVPYFLSDVSIDVETVAIVREWYGACSNCSAATRSRIEKGAHFLNRGMNADDVEAFVGYFVALDALFGERNAVEKSILAGVRSLNINPTFTDKASWLFELRSEIVHGGSRFLSEWPKYDRYTQHFQTEPMVDVAKLAQLAVLRAPYVLGASAGPGAPFESDT